MKHMYVDNRLTGSIQVKRQEFYSESKEVFQESSMNLREWGSNLKEFLKSIPEQDMSKGNHSQSHWNTLQHLHIN